MANYSKKAPYTDDEVAFLLGYANYCHAYGGNYAKSVANQLEEISGRKVTWEAVQAKVKTVLRELGSRGLAVQTFIVEGTECLRLNRISTSLQTLINAKLADWQLPLLDGSTAHLSRDGQTDSSGDTSGDDSVLSNSIDAFKSEDHRTATESRTASSSEGGTDDNDNVDRPGKAPELDNPRDAIDQHGGGRLRDVPQENSTAEGCAVPEQGQRRLAIVLHLGGSQAIDSTRSDDNMLPTQGNQVVAKRKASNDLSERSTKQTKEAPSVVTLAESMQLDDLLQLPSRATTIEELGQKFGVQQQVLHWCMEKLVDRGEAMASSTNSNIRKIFEDLSKKPMDVFANLYDRLETQDKELKRYKDIVEAMENIRMAVGLEDKTPEHLPSSALAGYLTCFVENIASGRYREEELENCIKHLNEHLKSTYAVQTLMGALFCRWVFQAPETMLEKQHSQLLMKYYGCLAVSGGIRAVQHQDMIATKLFFEDSTLREAASKPRATQLLENLSKALKTVCPSAPGFQVVDDLQNWAETMLNLRRTLMLSDKDYRIHFTCPSPDRKFDPNWMEAITADGRPFKKA